MKIMAEKSRKLTIFFTLIWVLNILYGEMFAFWVPVFWTCSWPHHQHFSSSMTGGGHKTDDFVKVAVLTDPQLMDRTSIGLPPKSLVLETVEFYTDLYMRRAFVSSVMPFKPDVILFLGDYFDGGPFLSNQEWQESLSRFEHIFEVGKSKRTKEIPVYYLTGNHDIGYAWHANHKPEVIERYETKFGRRNYKFTIGEVDFVVIDAQVVDGTLNDDLTSRTWDFVKNATADVGARSRVLLTHIPLYRPDGTYCGPHRSSAIINQSISRSPYDHRIIYQNYVSEKSSGRLLDLVQPALVLSGHDHDQCTVTHKTKHGPVEEHTVGTLSWQQGNWYPSFMLMSVGTNKSSLAPEVLVHLCFLPRQLFIYMWYIALFVITILALSFWPSYGIDIGHHCVHLMTNVKKLVFKGLSSSGSKEKNEDEDCEYEMMWDAEGGMHLVKKPRTRTPSVESKEINSVERGNAVMRTSRRQTQTLSQDEGVVKSDSDRNPGSSAVILPRSTKSTAARVVHGVLRVLGIVSVIAMVNVPLYMMLLFKDWVE